MRITFVGFWQAVLTVDFLHVITLAQAALSLIIAGLCT